MKKYLLLLLLCGCREVKYPVTVTKVRQSAGEKNIIVIENNSVFEVYFVTDSTYHVGDILR